MKKATVAMQFCCGGFLSKVELTFLCLVGDNLKM